ncbi:hypothetical protein CPLU01_01295 [Colletotrichum plurivorum]|uniref:Uncharacterized protein n=1 Tax=Colletotrichum plurivorum TaxID=2175906 RepID=A0A8H6NPR2_9PEZI|nr:hypothetical protein CPLU01_01295 [Colletotrichum plurivorum]
MGLPVRPDRHPRAVRGAQPLTPPLLGTRTGQLAKSRRDDNGGPTEESSRWLSPQGCGQTGADQVLEPRRLEPGRWRRREFNAGPAAGPARGQRAEMKRYRDPLAGPAGSSCWVEDPGPPIGLRSPALALALDDGNGSAKVTMTALVADWAMLFCGCSTKNRELQESERWKELKLVLRRSKVPPAYRYVHVRKPGRGLPAPAYIRQSETILASEAGRATGASLVSTSGRNSELRREGHCSQPAAALQPAGTASGLAWSGLRWPPGTGDTLPALQSPLGVLLQPRFKTLGASASSGTLAAWPYRTSWRRATTRAAERSAGSVKQRRPSRR